MGEIVVVARDAAGGAPVADAHVGAFVLEGASAEQPVAVTRGAILEGTTDAAGTCILRVDVPPGERRTIRVVVRARGRREWRDPTLLGDARDAPPVTLERGGTARFDVSMERGTTLEGRVTDATGAPVEGAHLGLVLVLPMGCSWPHAFGVADLHWPPPCVTDGDGRFRWLSFPLRDDAGAGGGHFVLHAEHVAFAPAMAHRVETLPRDADGVIGVNLVLPDGGALEVTVRGPDGAPLADATVTAEADRAPDQPWCVRFSRQATTDADGRCVLHGLAEGGHRVEIAASRCAPWTTRVRAERGGCASVVARLAPGSDVEGRVLDADGRPLAGTLVIARVLPRWTAFARPGSVPWRRGVTDGDGAFRLEGLPARCRVEVRAPTVGEVRVALPSPPVVLAPPRTFPMRVLLVDDRTGEPVGASAYLSVQGPGFSAGLHADAAGLCERDGMPEASYRLVAMGQEHADRVVRHSLGPSAAAAPLVIRLRRGGSVRGRVLDRAGAPVAGARIVAFGRHRYLQRGALTDADGAYRVDGLDGSCRFVCEADGFATAAFRLFRTGSADAPRTLEVTLGPGATVTGRVTGRDGAPAARAPVSVRPLLLPFVSWALPSTLADDDGAFTLRHVPPGWRAVCSGSARTVVLARHGREVPVTLRDRSR